MNYKKIPSQFQKTKLSPYECFVAYMGLKMHFTSSYDWFKYHGKIKTATVAAFEKRRDRFSFNKLAKHSDPIGLLVANLSLNPTGWVGDFLGDDGETAYNEWKSYQEALTYRTKEMLKKLSTTLDDCLMIEEFGANPKLLEMLLTCEVSLELVWWMHMEFNFFPYWDAEIQDPITWSETRKLLDAYLPFMVDIGSETRHNMLSEHFQEVTK